VLNFFVLYVVPLLFMTFVYVRISVVLWRSDTILSLPLVTLHLIQPQDRREMQPPRTSAARLFVANSYPNSPYLSNAKQKIGCDRSREAKDRLRSFAVARAQSRRGGDDGRRR